MAHLEDMGAGPILQSNIRINVPESTFGNISFFFDNEFERFSPFPEYLAEGGLTSLQFHSGLGVLDTFFRSGEEGFVGCFETPSNPIKFTFNQSSGAREVGIQGERQKDRVSGGESCIISIPSAVENSIPPNFHLRNLCIMVDPAFLETHLRDTSGQTPPAFKAMLEREEQPYIHKSVNTPAMKIILEQIRTCPLQGSLKRVYLEGKMMELLALRLEQLMEEPPRQTAASLKAPDAERVREAERILMQDIAEPPSLAELARRSGLNSKKLKYGFKEVFGATVFNYLRKARLEQARRLLSDKKVSVTEAAYSVGYSSLSHFSKIFKEEFGVYPGSL
jgi:AraC-like DNA-binding protein